MSRRTARGVISRRTSPTAARTGLSPKGRGAEDGDPLTSRGRIRGAARQGKRGAGADNDPGPRRRLGGSLRRVVAARAGGRVGIMAPSTTVPGSPGDTTADLVLGQFDFAHNAPN